MKGVFHASPGRGLGTASVHCGGRPVSAPLGGRRPGLPGEQVQPDACCLPTGGSLRGFRLQMGSRARPSAWLRLVDWRGCLRKQQGAVSEPTSPDGQQAHLRPTGPGRGDRAAEAWHTQLAPLGLGARLSGSCSFCEATRPDTEGPVRAPDWPPLSRSLRSQQNCPVLLSLWPEFSSLHPPGQSHVLCATGHGPLDTSCFTH